MSTGYESAMSGGASGGARKRHGLEQGDHSEGILAKRIEQQTARLPSDFWLLAAGSSVLASLAFRAAGESHKSLFVGQWAPTFLLLGIYNKMVKQHGSD